MHHTKPVLFSNQQSRHVRHKIIPARAFQPAMNLMTVSSKTPEETAPSGPEGLTSKLPVPGPE
jgi:hypothetical protein